MKTFRRILLVIFFLFSNSMAFSIIMIDIKYGKLITFLNWSESILSVDDTPAYVFIPCSWNKPAEVKRQLPIPLTPI